MIGDDLVPFFHTDKPDWGFRQGEVVSFDAEVGTSSVRVGGSVLTDVPFLSQAGQVIYLPGDAVLLVRFKSSWAIVGRYVTPEAGWSAAIGRYTEITGAYEATPQLGWSLSTSYVTKTSVGIFVPNWAQVATGTASLMAVGRNSTGADDFLNGRIQVNGTTWGGTSGPAVTGKWAGMTAMSHFQLLVTPGGTLTIDGQLAASGAAWAAHASNSAVVAATVTFNSNLG